MFSHIMLGTNDIAASKKFYDAALGSIGIPEGRADPKGRVFYRTKTGVFALSPPIDGKACTHANGGTVGFACDSPEKAKAFHDAGVANGGISIEDPPGWREGAFGKLYLAYLRDPYGNKICALHRPPAA
jgi:catechol 2,3-dioxygenase-like lactoylglutathione lyase family enzyme